MLPSSFWLSTLSWPRGGTRRSEDQGIFISSNYIKPDERLRAEAGNRHRKENTTHTHSRLTAWRRAEVVVLKVRKGVGGETDGVQLYSAGGGKRSRMGMRGASEK